MRRILAGLYGAVAYLAFLLPIGYLVGFLADIGVPKTVDRGAGPLGPPLVLDLLLLAAFGLQHSIMARPGFKKSIARWIPAPFERSTYVLASGTLLGLVFWLWRPVPFVLWDVSGGALGVMAVAGFIVGLTVAVWATFALSHLHLFGVSQTAAWVMGREHPRLMLRETPLYRIVRHPMTAGLLLLFWSTPRMTLGHAVFAGGMTVYSLIATVFEERDLLRTFPDRYAQYRTEVPALWPVLRPTLAGFLQPGLTLELVLVAAVAALAFAPLVGMSMEAPSVHGGRLSIDTLATASGPRAFSLFDPGPEPEPRPVVIALHGTGGSGSRLRGFLGGELDRAVTRKGWLVAYPDAWHGAWNGCRRTAAGAQRSAGIDDVAFLRSLTAYLVQEHGADPTRVFVLGYSGGGHMALRLALEAPDLVRGVAAFGANVPVDRELVCHPRAGTAPVLLVNGTRDLVNPWRGGDVIAPNGVALGVVRSSMESVRLLERLSAGRTEVRLALVKGGGHVVPGPSSRFPAAAGPNVRSFHGVNSAMAFFAEQMPPGRDGEG